jgi:Tol biopolymer transport system component
MRALPLLVAFWFPILGSAAGTGAEALRAELRGKGWIVFSARSERKDWDLFVCRADGSDLRNLTKSPEHGEILPRFSPDGRRILFRRLPAGETVDGNRHGTQGEAVLMDRDGGNAETLGHFPWASWGPDPGEITCLSPAGFQIVDLASRKVHRTFPRQSFFQQISPSPDGRRLVGVANSFGQGWSVACLDLADQRATPVSLVDCCTPSWFPDSQRVVFSNRPPGQKTNNGYGWTELWMANADGSGARRLVAHEGHHLYGGRISPDMAYVLFSGNQQEDGDPGNAGSPMRIARLADTPIVAGKSPAPVLELPAGFSPDWTASDE